MGPELEIRDVSAGDVESVRRLAVSNGMFAEDDLDGFDEMLGGYLDGTLTGHRWMVALDADGVTAGAAYVAPEPFADRMWNLYFLAVDADGHGRGVGSSLIGHVEQTLRDQGEHVARVLVVETSSLEAYAPARSFYAKQGFDEEARIRDFYGPGDNKVVYWKALYR